MTKVERADKQVLARQAAEMCTCSSRSAGDESEVAGKAQGSSCGPSRLCGLWELLKETQANFR